MAANHDAHVPHWSITVATVNQNLQHVDYATLGPISIRADEIVRELRKVRGCVCVQVRAMSDGARHTVDWGSVNPNLKRVEYAVRGPISIRAEQISADLKQGVPKPFTEIVRANIGDGQAMGQTPISSIREVLALVTLPSLLEDERFAADVKARARDILAACQGGTIGAYTDKKGLEVVRRQIARFIGERDGGVASDWRDIVMSAGATDAIKAVLKLLIADVDGKKAGVMIPIPQYPLYSATLAEFDLQQVNYYLDEEKGWSLDMAELDRSITEARTHCHPRAIVIINPGNPTGQVLSRSNIEDIIKFAHRERLFILSDEVYQHNVYAEGSQFHSFKKVLMEMGSPYNKMELASFMSCSKGYMGECGVRGGYCEVINLHPEVTKLYHKLISASTCPTVLGQATTYCVVNPIRPGEPSYDRFHREKTAVLQSLAVRAKMVADAFNSVPGMSCNAVQGAMYAFPRINIPPKALAKAEKAGLAPDAFYCLQLLEKTGMCIVPGSGFGQRPGTYHFRTTILPQPESLKVMLDKFRTFQEEFTREYN